MRPRGPPPLYSSKPSLPKLRTDAMAADLGALLCQGLPSTVLVDGRIIREANMKEDDGQRTIGSSTQAEMRRRKAGVASAAGRRPLWPRKPSISMAVDARPIGATQARSERRAQWPLWIRYRLSLRGSTSPESA